MPAKRSSRILSIVLALVLVLSLLPVRSSAEPTGSCSDANELRVGVGEMSGRFSPFLSQNSNDQELLDLVNLNLLTCDRRGYIISNAIEGETVNYNGTDYRYTGPADVSVEYREAEDLTVYTARLREDLKFWDGEPVTAKDLLFTYYSLLDSSYNGPNPLKDYDIVGLHSWQTQVSDELYDRYSELVDLMLEDGEGQGYIPNEYYTEEQYNDFFGYVNEGWRATIRGIYDYIMENYLDEAYEDYSLAYTGKTIEEIRNNDDLKTAYVMAMWGFGRLDDSGNFVDYEQNYSWDLVNTFPTLEDFFAVTKAYYQNDPVAFYEIETSGNDYGPIDRYARNCFIEKYARPEMNGVQISSISGVRMLDDYTVELTLRGYSTYTVYGVFDIPITPMHYYGDTALWDPANGCYGFVRGDLHKLTELADAPRGAGPYVFESYQDGTATLSANPNWFKGEPMIETIVFTETDYDGVSRAVSDDQIDLGEIYGSRDGFEEIAEINPNGELTGELISTFKIDNLGYGYVGINADKVNVNGVPDSDASKALRKALATVIAVYREAGCESYYGEAAKVIEYPVAECSWASPLPGDPGYQTAFSKDANGSDIYTPAMTAEERYAAAKAAALTWFQAAGYTVRNGKLTAAPNGAKLAYEVIIPGNGEGDHPSYGILSMASSALAQIGFTLSIIDTEDSAVLWDALDYGTQELWCAAWGTSIDPNLNQSYHSGNIVGSGGTNSNHYHIRDDELDRLLTAARDSTDQSFRKSVYRQCLDIIMDWAVEIPAYQRQNACLFSTQRIDIDTLTPDLTPFWSWKNDIEKLKLKNTHVWNEGVTTEPTCTEDGAIVYTCVICGKTKTEILPALGHVFERAVCTRCGYEAQFASEIFDDVKDGKWYAEAVLWALRNGITTGTGERSFSPNDTCTRAQVMTFLWHAEGDPAPSDSANPFTDNRAGKWYYNAVLWAYHHDPQITSGSSETLFGVNDGCTREQVVTFLWKTAGAPDPVTTENPFTDVKAGKWYYQAVLWAYENEITSGISEDTFGVHSTCTRAQIVTFLYKAYGQN